MPSERRVLEPVERISEVLFGLIMVLTFTGSLSAAEAGRADVHTMLVGAIGCNVAWGIIDAVMYLMQGLSERGSFLATVHRLRRIEDPAEGARLLAAALPDPLGAVMTPEEMASMHRRLRALEEPDRRPRLGRRDWLGAIAVFLWVFLTTFPVVIPFLLVQDPTRALRLSNAIAVALLFLVGWAWGRCAGYRPLFTGGSMVALGLVLVALTIALGG
jgi:VIT1/CCC1 family predicted Fe2+/Mn2+ transporter